MRGTRLGVALVCAAAGLTLGADSRSAGPALLGDPTDLLTASLPQGVAIGDLNGDGRPDLVATSDPAAGHVVSVLFGRGDGTYDRREYHTGQSPFSVAIGDLNRDGKPDLVTSNGGTGSVSVLLNRGDGRFRTHREYRAGESALFVAIHDLNGDGKLDLAVADPDGNSVSVLLNIADGTFQRHRDYRTGRVPEVVAVADVNGDGRPD